MIHRPGAVFRIRSDGAGGMALIREDEYGEKWFHHSYINNEYVYIYIYISLFIYNYNVYVLFE